MNRPTASGIITNYNCTASCRHCMFASSPQCENKYIDENASERIAKLLQESGTRSVHIGGGEPFMNFSALCTLIKALGKYGISIDYIETNAFWSVNEEFVNKRLEALKMLGVYSIMVSVDPFHIEYIPLSRPLLLCSLLEKQGFDYFIWQQRFLKRLTKLDISKIHTEEDLKAVLGEGYVKDTAREYGLGINGRALKIAEELYTNRSAEELATSEECASLTVPHHCHIDLYGKAVPSRCTGICADARDYLEENITYEKYPVFARLKNGGTKELYKYALEKGYVPNKNGYPTRCAFCYDMREYLERNSPSQDLAPKSFYTEMRKIINNIQGDIK